MKMLLIILLFVSAAQARTIVVPIGGDLQAAINSANCGDTVALQAGGRWETRRGGTFSYSKVCISAITITTSDPSTIPTALSNYPLSNTLITSAMAANMPKIVAVPSAAGAEPAFSIIAKSKGLVLRGIEFVNKDNAGYQIPRLVSNVGEMYNVSELPDNITIDECWIHPVEETGDGTNYQLRSVESGLYLDATNVTITRNAIQGFTGTNKYSYGGGPGSIRLDAKAILITGGTGPYTIANNLLEGWG